MPARKGVKAKSTSGEAPSAEDIEDEAITAADAVRDNPLNHPHASEVERAAVAAEDAVRTSYRR